MGARLRIAASVLAVAAAVLGFGPAAGTSAASTAAAHADASAGQTTCASSGEGGTTCTGTYSGDTGWDWSLGDGNGGETGLAPSVTVDQTTSLTNQVVHVTWKNFTPSMTSNYVAGYQQGHEFYGASVFQCRGADPQDFSADCNDVLIGTPVTGAAATGVESYTLSGTSTQPTDCTSVPTDPVCGTGYTDMQIQTSVQNSALGCSATVACSLVVLPFWGGNVYSSPPDCADHSLDLGNGGYASDFGYNPWYSPCTWADRITVPLTFADTSQQLCPAKNSSFSAQGSPMLERVMGQWQPGWCTASQGRVDFNYDSGVNEYEARSGFLAGAGALSASTDVALVTDPAPSEETASSSRQFTYAPVATSSITIAFYVDNQVTEEPVTDIKLDARLVAKLLTESYSLDFGQCGSGQSKESDLCDSAVEGNPVSIFADPEFYQLNPEYTEADFETETNGLDNTGDFLPIVMAGNSDTTYELTRWIESDPDARAFLEGQQDPWHMHVNTNYEQGVAQTYPIPAFQVLDPGFSPATSALGNTQNPFLATMQVAWNPVTGLDNVAADLANWTPSGDQFAPSCSDTSVEWTQCGGNGNIINAKDQADQFPQRALFAVLDSGTAADFRFPAAQLVNPAGNAEAPTTDSMTAAVNAMKTNPDGVTQYQNYANSAAAPYPADGYPLTEVQYAMVPTCGLSSAKSSAISTFLGDVANSQDYGFGLGQIPDFGGYLALDDAQRAQDLSAAQAVARQTCKSTPPDTTVSGQTPPTTGSGAGSGNPSSDDLGNSGGGAPTSPSSLPATASTPSAAAGPSTTASAKASATPIALGDKAADTSSDVRYILPVALAAGALLAIGGPLAYGFGTADGLRLPGRRRGGPPGPGGDDGSDGSDGGEGSGTDG